MSSSTSTCATLVWPVEGADRTRRFARFAILSVVGACLLTASAKFQVPGPVPMTMQTFVVLALGATLGARLAIASVALYFIEGAMGLPVFATTPPLAAGIAYMMGPTGGFLAGFLAAAGLVGYAADRGLIGSPIRFGLILAAGSATILVLGWAWLSFGLGVGFSRAFELGVRPFMLGEALKIGLAAASLPLLTGLVARFARR